MRKTTIIIVLTLLVSTISINIAAFNLNTNETSKQNKIINSHPSTNGIYQKNHISFAAFADTHIGSRYQYPKYRVADHLDKLGKDCTDNTNLLDFVINLGDLINHNTAHVNGQGLPAIVNQYKNNLKAYHISNINLPFHCVLGNHDLNDYEKNKNDPHNLTKSLIDETSLNNPVYAMMRDGILFLVVPELGYVQWTHPVEYEWVKFMTNQYPNATTVILSHQAIEDTTKETTNEPYRGKQNMEWWSNLFQNNPQIKMWIHGHNHYLDWYLNDHSTGKTAPTQNFGHKIAFSAPYSQLDFLFHHEEDRMVIYTISSTGITTAAWQNNGLYGHRVKGYTHTWNVNTTYDSNKKDWYSFPMFLQDNETQLTDMKILSPDITLQLVGSSPMELFYDSKMESPPSRYTTDELIPGFGNDNPENVEWTDPGVRVHGPTSLDFPEKYPHPENMHHEDGRSGPAYQSFPMGTICSAIPGQTYEFTVTARSNSGNGKFTMNVSCNDWSTKSQYSTLPNSKKQAFSHGFNSNYETITGTYTVPDNKNAWFLQGELDFLDNADYDISLFSVKRKRTSDTTDNFKLLLSGTWYNTTGSLNQFQTVNFSVDPTRLCNNEGVMNFTAFIDGNNFGIANVVYQEPVLMTRNARFKISDYNEHFFNLSLTKTISRYSKIFKIFPFTADPSYKSIGISTQDESGIRHKSKNGNIWLSCNSPRDSQQNITVYLHSGYIEKPKKGVLYLLNKEIIPTFFEKTIVIGDINITAKVYNEKNVSKVEFYLDGVKQHEDKTPPFNWTWDKKSFTKHSLTIKTYYPYGLPCTDQIEVYKLL